MGVVQSIFCSVTFCVERVLTWTCCAVLLMMLMFVLILLMVYGISVGYHYAQKELASFAMSSRSTTETPLGEVGGRRAGGGDAGVVRLVAVNHSETRHAPHPLLEVYQTNKPPENIYMEARRTPAIFLETERPPKQPELTPREQELAKKLIGRFRRSKQNVTAEPFLRPLNARNSTYLTRLSAG